MSARDSYNKICLGREGAANIYMYNVNISANLKTRAVASLNSHPDQEPEIQLDFWLPIVPA